MRAVLCLLGTLSFFNMSAASADQFRFIALGDMPYGKPAKVYPPYEALIGAINKRNPAFSIHVGDTKSGGTPCSNKVLDDQLAYFSRFKSALIYTPGDNEWTDCYRKKAGSFDPLERLAYIRKTYFKNPSYSFGKRSIKVKSQAVKMSDKYAAFPENIRFEKEGVHFITAHLVGSNNNFENRELSAVKEFFSRDKANMAWLKLSFKKAIKSKAKAVVLAIHADMFEFSFNKWGNEKFLRHSGYRKFAKKLVKWARKFKKPVLLIYGDSHVFRQFRPLPKSAPNIMALEVYGSKNMHAVEVNVDTTTASVFSIRPLLNPQKLNWK